MLQITPHDDSVIVNLLQAHDYRAVYNKLKGLLSEKDLAFFAVPEPAPNQTNWFIDAPLGTSVYWLPKMETFERDQLADEIEDWRIRVARKLDSKPELENFVPKLFQIPSLNSVAVWESDGQYQAVLSQWGCAKALQYSNHDPLTLEIERPRPGRMLVKVRVLYTDGTPVVGMNWYLHYREKANTFQTDANGMLHIGTFRLDTEFGIGRSLDDSELHKFQVSKGGEYVVKIIRTSSAVIRILDDTGKPLPQVEVLVEIQGHLNSYLSDEEGQLSFKDLPVGSTIKVTEQSKPSNTQKYLIQ